ncbi:MAG: asparagine synthase (glutamine-hydrolyzing) [Proteobacteria bacterium]|nr:asparagine synthase (glutamine-hydrolyzing) [Pseudomonadota bacterium]
MCGIAGYVGNFNARLLGQMHRVMAHRGPDGDGVWTDTKAGVGLAHRRLSIIDLSEAAGQPMQSVDGRYVIVFNGEIYNFKELAEDLKAKGYQFNPNSDTAILTPLYDAYGTKMVEKLSGIFAFAIWDKQEKALFAARDHLGIKPFYYTVTPSGMLFASEMKSLLQSPEVKRDVDEEALFSYISYLWSPGEKTLFKSVHKLLPGHFMMVKGGHMTTTRWYQPPQAPLVKGKPQYNRDKTPQDLLNLLDEVVREQMVADVAVGAFLSGGLDSSTVVSSMAKTVQNPADIQTFCISFTGQDGESEGFGQDVIYAREVAKTFGVSLNEVEMTSASLESLPETVFYLDEPQADPAPIYVKAICSAARAKGMTVMMSGTGGDDIFSGYRRHVVMNLKQKLDSRLPTFARKAAAGLLSSLPVSNSTLKRRLTRLSRLLATNANQALIAAYYYTEPAILQQVLSPELRQAYASRRADHLEETLDECQGQHLLNRQLYMELFGFLPDHNLNYTDKLSMAAGVEVRVPLLDPKLLDFAADLPPEMKLRGGEGKYILKKAMEARLPKHVIYRSKAGFGAPIRSWMVGEKEQFMRDVVLSDVALSRGLFDAQGIETLIADTKSGKVDGAYTLLSLMVIELWLRQFMDKKVPTMLAA